MAVEVELLKGPAKGAKKVISDARARAFVNVGFARVVTPEDSDPVKPAATIPVVPASEPAVETNVADQAAPDGAEPTEPPDTDISPRTGRPRRQYRRRDVVAED